MAKQCATEKTAFRQQWIENGLLELMQEHKFDSITVTDLCRHLQLSRRSFYRYFRDMEDVLDSLIHRAFQDMSIEDAKLTAEDLEHYYRFWLQHKPVLNALAYSEMHSKLPQYALQYVDEHMLKDYLSVDDLGMDLSREMNLFVICGLASLLISWHAEGFQKSPGQMAQISLRMLSKPLLMKQ